MSEEHDVDFTGGNQTELCESGGKIQDSVDAREISASDSSTVINSAINKEKERKLSLKNDDEKNEGTEVKNVGVATIKWAQEDELFKVSWSLPGDTASKKDYVALYCKGECLLFYSKQLLSFVCIKSHTWCNKATCAK